MQVMHQSPVLGHSLSLTKPTPSTVNTTTTNTPSSSTPPTSNALCPSSTSTTRDSLVTSVPQRGHKYHVASACVNCKKAHLACDVSRPCKRCVLLGKTDTCLDIKHKKRGRPKLPPKKPKTNDTTPATAIHTVNVNNDTTSTDRHTATPHSHPASDTLSTPYPISFCHQSIETFQKPHQGNTSSSPTPTVKRTDDALDQHDGARNTASSPSLPPSEAKMTWILTMELCFARVSDDATTSLGYYPQELTHRSMYDFIATQGTPQLSQLHRRLLDSVMEASSQQEPTQHRQAPPSTERTTSDLFHQKTIKELSVKANESPTFTDSLNIITRSGPNELYNVCVYLGGGLGADLEDVSTFTKLYTVMVCQKKYIDNMNQDQQHHQQQQHNTPRKPPSHAHPHEQHRRPPYKSILPLLAPSPTSPSSMSTTSSSSITSNSNESSATTTTTAPSINRYAAYRNRPIKPKPHDLRQISLPAHFANNSDLNTISFGTHQTPPKINIAPTSSSTQPSPIPYAYFRPIASAPTMISIPQTSISTTATSKNQQKTLITIPYRPTLASSSSVTPSGPRKIASIDHPTSQYVSQTSSGKAAQNPSDTSSSSASETATSRKQQGISIRSLLC